jgi:hypothetical protein
MVTARAFRLQGAWLAVSKAFPLLDVSEDRTERDAIAVLLHTITRAIQATDTVPVVCSICRGSFLASENHRHFSE